MKKQNQQYALGALVLIVAVAGFLLFKTKRAAPENGSNKQPAQQNPKPAVGSPTGAADANVWEGKLLASDNAKSGNLMLVTKERTIYIKTSRDFAGLLNKNVRVTYEGTWQNFVLGDITLAEQ